MPAKRPISKKHIHRHKDGTIWAKGQTIDEVATGKPKSTENPVDGYLAALPDDKRAALEKLRGTIRTAAPGAEECISYMLPAFRLDGKVLVLFGASAKHCTFFPGSGTAVDAHKAELGGYGTSKGAIRFQPDDPLPARLVRKLVKYRIEENAAQRQRSPGASSRRRGRP